MEGVSGLNLQMAPASGNIYLKANKNVTVSCFPKLESFPSITLMRVFSPDNAGGHICCSAQLPLLLPAAPQGMAPRLWFPHPSDCPSLLLPSSPRGSAIWLILFWTCPSIPRAPTLGCACTSLSCVHINSL